MEGTTQTLRIDGYACSIYLPALYPTENTRFPVIYINGEIDVTAVMTRCESLFPLQLRPFLLVAVKPKSWNDDFTPWPAPALKKDAAAFGGLAKAYLHRLETQIKPTIDTRFSTLPEPENTALIGYSLAGLSSLYALYAASAFGNIGCLSGSLWYDGWLAYMQSHLPVSPNSRVYLSLGSGEPHSRNGHLASVGRCTQKAAELLAQQLNDPRSITFEWNAGGHFADIPGRFLKAIRWLMRSPK